MKIKTLVYVLIAAVLFSACSSKEKKAQTITLSGAFALYPLAVKWTEEYKKIHPEVNFNVTGGGAGKGLADALAGVVDLGMFSRSITQVEKDKGTWWVGLTIDAVVPTINANNPYIDIIKSRGLTKEDFTALFIDSSKLYWSDIFQTKDKQKIEVYTRSDACGAAETWAKYLGKKKQEDLKGIGIFGDPGVAEAVAKDPLGIGFNNTIYAYDIKTGKKREGIEVVPIDINGNGKIDADENFYGTFEEILTAIAAKKYPSPPARELYFVAKGKPQKQAVLDFIQWTLTDGQKYVKEAGYVPIDDVALKGYIEKLK
jgi:phosphate transport system substrate-binding protein